MIRHKEEIYYKISNASSVDLNVKDDFELKDMVKFITEYSKGKVGSNLITVTVADLNTYQMAAKEPEHQKQHERRPFFIPEKRTKK